MMPRDWWEGGMLRETQSRVGDSVPYTSPHSQSTPSSVLSLKSDHKSEEGKTMLVSGIQTQVHARTRTHKHHPLLSLS